MNLKKFLLCFAAAAITILLQAGTEKSLRISRAGTNGEVTERFFVLDVPGKMPGSFVRPEAKFTGTAARARAAVNGSWLEVFITCGHPAGMKPEGGAEAWQGDCAEFFLQPAPQSTVYFQYAVNADGKLFAAKYSSPSVRVNDWKSGSTATVRKTNDYFLIVLRIPRSELEGADWRPGSEMRGNFIRSGKTGGGVSCWSKVGASYHDLSTFGVLLVESRSEYFRRRLETLTPDLKKNSSPALTKKVDEILKRADDPKSWETLQQQLNEMELALMQQSGSGTLLWQAPVWDNSFKPTPAVKPLKELKLTAARNSRAIAGFAFSNLSDRPFMGQLKFLSRNSLKYLHEFNRLPFDESLDLAHRIRLSEAIRLQDLQNLPNYEPLAPLPLQTLIRCQAFETVPLFLSIDTRGMKPGIYRGVFYLKPSYGGFARQQFDFTLEVLDVDLAQVQLDNYVWDDMMHSKKHHMGLNRAKFMVDHEFNVLLITSIGFQLEFLPEITEEGEIVKQDWTDLDNCIDLYLQAGMAKERLKLLFQFGQADRGLLIAGGNGKRAAKWSPAWVKAVKTWIPLLGNHLEEKYGITRDRWWFYPWDEPNGDPADPASTAFQAVRFAKLYKEADPNCRTFANPYDWKDTADAASRFKGFTPWFDLLVPNRSYLKNQEMIDLVRQTGREIWTYNVLSDRTSPVSYRWLNWLNQRDGYSGPASFWVLDVASGGDGFDPFDTTRGNNRVDYAVAYPDHGADEILTSRRLEAHFQGHLDRKAMKLCVQLLEKSKAAGKDTAAARQELDNIVRRGCAAKSMDEYQQLHVELLQLALRLQQQLK